MNPVISEHIWHGNAQYSGADTIFLTKLQKGRIGLAESPYDNMKMQVA